MCEFRVSSMKPPEDQRAGSVVLEAIEEGKKLGQQTVYFWPADAFAKDLVVGAQAKAEFRTSKGKPKTDGSGNWPDEKFLKSWNGKEAGKPRRANPNQPEQTRAKSEQEILAALAIAAVKLEEPDKAFDKMIELVNRGKGRLQ